MSKDIVKRYFLRVGCSYYESDEFKALAMNWDFKPTSRFGIGILSCFLTDDSSSRIEVSTKYYKDSDGKETLRLSIPKLQGYYYLCTEANNRNLVHGIESGISKLESLKSSEYRKEIGTTIAVRFSISKVQTYFEMSIKDIIDNFVAFPDVPIHYKNLDIGEEVDYMTEENFAKIANVVGPYTKDGFSKSFEYSLSDALFQELKDYYPEAKWEKKPKLETEIFHLREIEPFKSEPCMDGLLMMSNTSCSEPVLCKINSKIFYAHIHYRFYEQGGELFVSATYPYTVYGMLSHMEKDLISAGDRFHEGSREKELYKAILNGSYYKKEWREKFWEEQNISEKELSQKLCELLHLEVDSDKLLEYLTYRKYMYEFCWKYKFTMKIPAYEEALGHIFSEHYLPDCLVAKSSYNGIYTGAICGFSCYPTFGWDVTASVIILKNKYRPDLSISRSRVIDIPLEVACMLLVLQMYLQHIGREVFISPYIKDSFRISLIEYKKVFHAKPLIIENLYVDTYEGMLKYNEIKQELKMGKTVVLNTLNKSFQQLRLSIAALNEHFDICIEINQSDHTIISVFCKDREKDRGILSSQIEYFVPGLFLYTVEPGSKYLSAGTKGDIPVYNIEHPFSKWLITNREKIEENISDVFKAMCNYLCIGGNIDNIDNIDERRIENINRQLYFLKEHKSMQVPDNVFLSKKDFLSLDK